MIPLPPPYIGGLDLVSLGPVTNISQCFELVALLN